MIQIPKRLLIGAAMLLICVTLMLGRDRLWDWAAGQPRGDDLIRIAAANGDLDGVRRAIEQGAAIDGTGDGMTPPLCLAASSGNSKLVCYLLEQGAFPDAAAYTGITALGLAVQSSESDPVLIRALLDAGADPNGRNVDHHVAPPLVRAAAHGNDVAVALLLEAGADPNLCGNGLNDWSPLTAALEAGFIREPVVRRLIEAGADPNRADRSGVTPVEAASSHAAASILIDIPEPL